MTAKEDALILQRQRDRDERFGTGTVIDTRTMRRVYVPKQFTEQQEESKRFRGEIPKDE